MQLLDALSRAKDIASDYQICESINVCINKTITYQSYPVRSKRSSLSQLPLQDLVKLRQMAQEGSVPRMEHMGVRRAELEIDDIQADTNNTFTVVQLADIHISPEYSPVSDISL